MLCHFSVVKPKPHRGWMSSSMDVVEEVNLGVSSMKSLSLEEKHQSVQLREIFGNTVIWRTLSGFLDFDDLLALRITNQLFYNLVNDCQAFQKQLVIHMTKEALNDKTFQGFLRKYPKWNSLSVAFCVPNQDGEKWTVMRNYYPLIMKSDVKNVRLLWKEGRRRANGGTVSSAVFRVLSNTPQLTKLEIEFVLLARIEFWASGIQVKEVLRRVTDFKIFQGRFEKLYFTLPSNYFLNNMRYFETVFFQLKNLTIEKFPDLGINTVVKVHLLIKNNSFTLESLEILYPVVWHKTRMGQLICPKLKRFSTAVKVGYYHDTFVKDFLKNQPSLEHISISMDENLDSQVLSIIQQKHLKNLKSLHLQANKIVDGKPPTPFKFLAASNLQEFSLIIPLLPDSDHVRKFGIEECESLLQYLPSTIKKLKFEGLNLLPTLTFNANRLHFSRLMVCKLTTLEFAQCKGLTGNKFWIKDLNGFKGLQTLTIKNLGLTDADILSFKFNSLRNLDVSRNKLLSQAAVQIMVNRSPSLELLTCSIRGIRKEGRLKKIIIQDLDWISEWGIAADSVE